MRDYGIDKGLVEFRDDSKRDQRGWGKGFFGFRKMFRDYLTKLNVAFYDACCPALTGDIFPLRFNAAGGGTIERFNGTAWVTVDTVAATETFTGITTNTINAGGTTVVIGNFLSIGTGGVENGGMLAPFIPQSLQQNITAGTGGAINVTSYFTTINTDAGGDTFTLANGTVVGQLKKIRLVVDGGGDGVVTPTLMFGGTTITFNDANDEVELMWTGVSVGWVPIYNVGATIA